MAKFGDIFEIETFGMWYQVSGKFEVMVTGIKGSYPNLTYRLTKIGEASIYKTKFKDYITTEKPEIGYGNALFRIVNGPR